MLWAHVFGMSPWIRVPLVMCVWLSLIKLSHVAFVEMRSVKAVTQQYWNFIVWSRCRLLHYLFLIDKKREGFKIADFIWGSELTNVCSYYPVLYSRLECIRWQNWSLKVTRSFLCSGQWWTAWSQSWSCSSGTAVGELCWLWDHPSSQCMGFPHSWNHAVQQAGLQFSIFWLSIFSLWAEVYSLGFTLDCKGNTQINVILDNNLSMWVILGYRASQGWCEEGPHNAEPTSDHPHLPGWGEG